jgi:gamma-glutamylcyclotransferase (GGCT)/AIG2-like uncharacterized protein YtfP
VDASANPGAEPSEGEYLFAYGTLQPEYVRDEIAHLVRGLECIGKGTVAGILYDLGSFPGAVLDPASPRRIRGTVFRLPEDERLLRELDEYEEFRAESPGTSQFIRRIYAVQMTSGRVLTCWVYEYNGPRDKASILESGVFMR